jgi:hypothetical protein
MYRESLSPLATAGPRAQSGVLIRISTEAVIEARF